MPRVFCIWFLTLFLSPMCWAGDDLSESLREELNAELTAMGQSAPADSAPPAPALPQEAPAAPQEMPAASPELQSTPSTAVTDQTPLASPLDLQAAGEEASSPLEPLLPQAENVDLREVISKPLHEALPITPAPATTETPPSPSVTSSSESPAATAPIPPVEPTPTPAPETVQPLRMLGAEVLPGTTTRLAWSVKDSLAGISVPTPVLVVHGQKPGPRVCLTAALHGDELNGIEVVRRVMYDLQADKLSGTVIGVPIVNLQGFRRASRYLPDRRDLNRYFPGRPEGSSAARIAHSFFTEVMQHCQYLVDLHTGSFRRTNLPQLRADLTIPVVAELSRNMGAIVVLQSKGARGSLRRAAVDMGIPAVTMEAGEPHNVEPDAVAQGVLSIETLLSKLNMYPYKGMWARKSEPVYYKSRWVRVPSGGILLNTVRLGERVKRDQVLGSVTDPITNASSQINSPLSGRVIGMALNQVMLPGFAAYHIGYQATAEEAAEFDAGPDEAVGDDAEVEESEDGFESLPPTKSSE